MPKENWPSNNASKFPISPFPIFYLMAIVIKTTTVPEMTVPASKSGKDFFQCTPKTKAAKAPVIPPRKGMGVAAKTRIVHSPYFLIFSPSLSLVCRKSQVKNFLKKERRFERNLATGSSAKKIKSMAKYVPKTDQNHAETAGIPNWLIATGMETLSSVTGTIAIKKVANSFGKPAKKLITKSCIISIFKTVPRFPNSIYQKPCFAHPSCVHQIYLEPFVSL